MEVELEATVNYHDIEVGEDGMEEEGQGEPACVEAGRRSPRLDRGKAQEKRAKRGVSFRSCALEGWPAEVSYTHTPDMSDVSPADKRLLRQDYLPGVAIRRVTDPAHPACGQNGLYATAGFQVGDVLGEYTGKVMPGHWGGEYVTRLWNTGANSDYFRPGVDAQKIGNELRMINDFRGVPGATGHNCKFSRAAIRGFRAALIVAIKPIAPNEELLLDYGEVYWRQELLDEDESAPGSPKVDGRVKEATVSAVLSSDLADLESDLVEMVEQATED
jgi:hypothetical protein